jgi:excisionase family DNA binding protein
MNIKDTAAYLRLNYMTVYKLAQKGQLPAFKVGGTWRFKKEILDDWVQKKSGIITGTVLIVDDDLLIQDILKEIIEDQNCTVSTSTTGEEALELIGRQRFDVIFLDLKLPGISGTDVFKAIKAKNKDAVVVIVTGYADDPIALEAVSLGPLFLIRKPFREKDVLEVLNMVLKGKKA